MNSHYICYGTPLVNMSLCLWVASETVPVSQEAGRREVSCFEEGLRTTFLQSGSRCLGRKWRMQLPAPLWVSAVLINAAKVYHSQKGHSDK